MSRAEERAARGELERRALIRGVFGTNEGEAVLLELLKMCGLLACSHAMETNACDTAFREGRRSIGLELLTLLRLDEAFVARLALKQLSEVQARQAQRNDGETAE